MSKDGSTYSPVCKTATKACEKGEFPISVIGLDHGHINGMVQNMLEAGATLDMVWDKDPEKMKNFKASFPKVMMAKAEEDVYASKESKMILSSIIPNERWKVGLKALSHGKHYMSDKTGFTELDKLEKARSAVAESGLKWSICFSERLQVESAILAGQLIEEGEIGDVIQIMNIAPHRLAPETRPDWFFNKEQYGGILCDIGSHQFEQMLFYTKSKTAEIVHSQVGNYKHPDYPELEDFGDCTLLLESGATGYTRLDWFTPEGLGTWGDGRLFILGTKGYIELRKYINVGVSSDGDNLYLVNGTRQEMINAAGKTGFPYFAQLIRDCLDGTDLALPQEHVFEVSRIAIEAEQKAKVLKGFQ
jgi:predicted dehydrogenase